MGTRNLICVQKDNEIVVAKYCQWDGYPDGQGKTILDFICNDFNKNLFVEKLQQVSEITDKEFSDVMEECGADPNEDTVTIEIGDKIKKRYPYLERDMGGDILKYIQESTVPLKLSNAKDFALDSLFCEYAYVLNLDEDTLDFYVGGNKEVPEKSIFFDPEIDTKKCEAICAVSTTTYYAIDKIESFPFDKIKVYGVEEILKQMRDQE